LARSLRYGQGVLLALLGLGEANDLRGMTDDADALYREALQTARELEEPNGACLALAGLAGIAGARGDIAGAEAALAADDFRDDPSLATGAALVHGRAQLAELKGQTEAAEAWHREVLLMRRELGDQRGLVEELEALGRLASHGSDDVRAAKLLGAAA